MAPTTTCRMPLLLLLLAYSVLPTACYDSASALASFVALDADAEATLGRLGQVEILAPAAADGAEDDELPLPPLAQPFSVVLSANLYPGVDYRDWAMCYAVYAHNATASNATSAAGASGAAAAAHPAAVDTAAAAPPPLLSRPTPALPPYCVSFSVVDHSVQFEPLSKPTPPLFDGFSAAGPHTAVAWFESRAEPTVKWGAAQRRFAVARPLPKHADGRAHFLASDSGADEFEDDVWIVDGELRVSKNPATHAFFKTTPTVCGALIEPRATHTQAVAHALKHVLAALPMVRPLHLFHAQGLLDGCDSAKANAIGGEEGGSSASLANGAGIHGEDGGGGITSTSTTSTNGSSTSSNQRSSSTTSAITSARRNSAAEAALAAPLASAISTKPQGWAFALGPLSFIWKHGAAPGAAAAPAAAPAAASPYETAASVWQRPSNTASAPEPAAAKAAAKAAAVPASEAAEDAAVSAATAYLCGLVASEAVVSHPLTVASLSAAERGQLLKSRVFWSRLEGSDKVLIFDADSLTAAGGCGAETSGGVEASGASGGGTSGGGTSGGNATGAAASALLPPQPPSVPPSPPPSPSPPRLVRDFAAKFDFIDAPGAGSSGRAEASGGGVGGFGGGTWSLRDVKMVGGCAAEYGHLVGSEDEAHFFERCVKARGGKVANATEHPRFRAAVCPRRGS